MFTFFLRRARPCGRLLHRILQRNCTGFCTAFDGTTEVVIGRPQVVEMVFSLALVRLAM